MRRALVTGGAGFIGSHLARALLADGIEVRVLDDLSSGKRDSVPSGSDFIEGSVLDSTVLANCMMDVDTCFHLAAVASVEACTRELVQSHAVNVSGWVNILDIARRAKARPRLVYASSAAVYGENETLPLSEDSATRPVSAYAADKLSCEHHATAAWRNYSLPSVGLRFFNVYGPGQDPASPYSGVISKFADALVSAQRLTIFGGGHQTRDFVFVSDVVGALQTAADREMCGSAVYNVCTGRSTSIRELAATMSHIFGLALESERGPARLGEVQHSRGDPTKAEAELGYSAKVELEAGLSSLLATIRHD